MFEGGAEMGPRLDIKKVDNPGWVQHPQNEVNVAHGQQERVSRNDLQTVQWTPPNAAQASGGRQPPGSAPSPQPTSNQGADAPARMCPSAVLIPPPEIPDEPVSIIRGQGDVLPVQGRGPMPPPQNYLNDSSPQGDPLAPAFAIPIPTTSGTNSRRRNSSISTPTSPKPAPAG